MKCRRFVIDNVNGAVNVIDLLKNEVKAVVTHEWRAERIADELMRNAKRTMNQTWSWSLVTSR